MGTAVSAVRAGQSPASLSYRCNRLS